MEANEPNVFDQLTEKLTKLTVNMKNPRLYKKYITDPPNQLVRLNKNMQAQLGTAMKQFIELNKYDYTMIRIAEIDVTFTRYLLKSFSDGLCEEFIIDIHLQNNMQFIPAYVVGSKNMYNNFYNHMINSKITVNYEGDEYIPELKSIEKNYEMIPSHQEVNNAIYGPIESQTKMLRILYEHSTKKVNAVQLFNEYKILETIPHLLINTEDEVFVPVLMIINNIFNHNDKLEINKLYPSLLYFIKETVDKIYAKYDIGNMYFRNAIMYSGQVRSHFY